MEYSTLLVPSRCLPYEILSEIFLHCMGLKHFEPPHYYHVAHLDKTPRSSARSAADGEALHYLRQDCSFALTIKSKYLKNDVAWGSWDKTVCEDLARSVGHMSVIPRYCKRREFTEPYAAPYAGIPLALVRHPALLTFPRHELLVCSQELPPKSCVSFLLATSARKRWIYSNMLLNYDTPHR